MSTKNFIGETMYVSPALPVTNDAAGFRALTWTKAAGLQQQPQLGVSHANIDVEDLETGFTAGVKGAGTGNTSSMAFRDPGLAAPDPGQAIIRAASDGAEGILSIMIVRGSGPNRAPAAGDPVEFAQGYAHSYLKNQGNVTNHKGFTAGFKQNAPTVESTYQAGGA